MLAKRAIIFIKMKPTTSIYANKHKTVLKVNSSMKKEDARTVQ
jgi:hypothetical protein